MDATLFWQLIEATYSENAHKHNEDLKAALLKFVAREIIEFNEIYDRYYHSAYRWDLWAVAYIIGGGCSDDGFIDFRSMLIRRGREFYREMMANPEETALLYNVQEEDYDDMFGWGIADAYQVLKNCALPPTSAVHPDKPLGDKWKEEELEELYPRLTEKFG